MFRWSLLCSALLLVGCNSGHIKDPNDPRDKVTSPEILRRNLRAISDALIARRLKREIDSEEYKTLISKAADELVKEMDLDRIDPAEAWQYGEVLRTAKNWAAARVMLEIAVKHDKATHNEDRRVNDTLRLAEVEAHLGEIPKAFATAGEVLDARPSDSAPILMAVLYEIAPVVRGKGHDQELATLLEAAIGKHLTTVVDTKTDAGKEFVAVRPYHVSNAYFLLGRLYDSLNKPNRADEARVKAESARKEYERIVARNLAASSRPPSLDAP